MHKSLLAWEHLISTHPSGTPFLITIPSGLQPSHGLLGLTTNPQDLTVSSPVRISSYFLIALLSLSRPHCNGVGAFTAGLCCFVIDWISNFGYSDFLLLIIFPKSRCCNSLWPLCIPVMIFALLHGTETHFFSSRYCHTSRFYGMVKLLIIQTCRRILAPGYIFKNFFNHYVLWRLFQIASALPW